MRPIVLTRTGTGVTAVAPLDTYISPFNVGMGAVVSGTATYTVQHTFDNVQAPGYNPASGNWFNHPTMTGLTGSQDGNYAFPVTAIRVNVVSGTGTVTLTAIQAGVVGG
jgi:hypothetical protein